jgi:sigma-B regulation protein RsbU (phosphoserine phosphatase)
LTLFSSLSGSAEENELIPLLLKRQAELNSLLEVTQAINRNSSASVLFEMLEVILKVHLKIGKMRLLVREREHFYLASKYGGEVENTKSLQQICQVVQQIKNIDHLSAHKDNLVNQYSHFVPVLHKNNMLAFVLIGDFDTKPELLSNDLNFMQTLINVIVVALENKKLFKERIQRERLVRDMELASEVQNMLVPARLPNNSKLQMSSMYLPNQNISGDYFDFIRLSEHEFLWCIADVSGKGISAALLMANLQASLRAWVSVEDDLMKVIEKMNQIVIRNTNGERFITFFLGRYNEQTRQMQYVNAGHNPPILIMQNKAIFLKQGTTMIGAFDELPFINMGSVHLEPDSLIFNYTDGLIESPDESVFIAEEELVHHLLINKHLSVQDINRTILSSIQASHRVKMNSDDVTMLTIKIS